MDKKDAIKCLNTVKQWIPDWDDREDGLSYWDAIDMAIDALSPPNEPLTLEQLREMDGNPVWVVLRGMHEKDEPMWCVLESPMALIPGVDYWSWDFDGYGETWIAYRRPPEGEEDK